MKILEKKRNNNDLFLKFEDDFENIQSKTDVIFQKEKHKYRIPGFRKGKATREVFDQHFGTGFLLEQALNEVLNDCYQEAIKSESLLPVDHPRDVEVEQFEEGKPVVFSFSVYVRPEIQLKKYKGLRTEQDRVDIDDSDIDKKLKEIQESLVEFKDTTNSAKLDDIIRYNMKATCNGEVIQAFTKDNQGTRIGLNHISADFDEQLVGLMAGDTKSIQLTFPNDSTHAELQGKVVDFHIDVLDLKERFLPPLDDALAQKVSEHKTLEDLKSFLSQTMNEQGTKESENKMKEQLMEELVENNPFDIPEAMVTRQIETFITRLKGSLQQQNLTWEDYLKYSQKSPEDIENEYKDPARKRVATDLILEAIIAKEEITVTDETLEKEYNRIAEEELKKPISEVRGQLEATNHYIKEYLSINQAVDFVVQHAKIKVNKSKK